MKQTVIIFTGKHQIIPIGKTTPKGTYDEDKLMEVVNKCFPSDKFDVQIIDYPKCQCRSFYNFEKIWKEVRLPILIGYREGANYIEPIKNFKRKYLISPLVYTNSFNDTASIDEYDDENTFCLFGGAEKSIKNAKYYSDVYSHIDTIESNVDLCKGIEYAMLTEVVINAIDDYNY